MFKKLKNKILNLWYPYGHEYKITLPWYQFNPKKSITAYELWYYERYFPWRIEFNMKPEEFEKMIEDKYNSLPKNMRKHFKKISVNTIAWKSYE